MTQRKIELYHQMMKNVVKPQHYYFPWVLRQKISRSVEYYNHQWNHAALNNVTLTGATYGQQRGILSEGDIIKHKTMLERKRLNQRNPSSSKLGSIVQI